MKVAVYTIALNEEKFVKRWFDSAREADVLLIADTGSTDNTITLARDLGIVVHSISVVPWRFDVARNASLALLPKDIDLCIQLDMDEVLQPGWREILEESFERGINWPTYRYVTNRAPDGTVISFQDYFKIHSRHGFLWSYPIHEVIAPQPGTNFRREFIKLEVDHLQDHTKNRGSYIDLLVMAVQEMPNDWRMAHYLNRERWYQKNWHEVIQTAYKALEIENGWDVERASTCIWASEAAQVLGYMPWALEWAERATREAPNFYEAWHWKAHIAHMMGKWQQCYDAAKKIEVLERQRHHLVKPEVWEWWGRDLLALSSHRLGFDEEAVHNGEIAALARPDIERLQQNLIFYKEQLENSKSTTN